MAADGSNLVQVSTAIFSPLNIAIDSRGNIYATALSTDALFEIPVNGGPLMTLAMGFSLASAVAVDGAGNIYVEDKGTRQIYRVPPGGGTKVAVGPLFTSPQGMAVDAANRIDVTDATQTSVTQMSPTGGYFINPGLPAGLSFDNTTGIISGTPTKVSAAADFLVSAYNANGGGSATVNITVNIDPKPFISYSSPQNYPVNVPITPLTPANMGAAVAGPTGAYGSPVGLGSGLTAAQNGGAVDAAGNVYVYDQNSGIGVVKKISTDGSSTTVIGSGFSNLSGNTAVDAAGNVYVTDQRDLWKIPASGAPVTYGIPVVINNTFTQPFGLAIDGANNIYVTDFSVGGIYKMANDGSNKVRIDNGISKPTGVAVDAAGNVYAVDSIVELMYEIPANGDPQAPVAAGFSFPRGLAVDAAGNIYVADLGAGDIYMVPPGGGVPVAVASGLPSVLGVAVDGSYNLYVTLQDQGAVSKISPTGGYFISPVALPAGLSFDNTTGIISGKPTVLSPATNYLVSAYNNAGGMSDTVNIKVASTNASLLNLVLSSGTLSPSFAGGTNSYTANVSNAVSAITVTLATADPNARVTINNVGITSGVTSGSIPLNVGANTITVNVTAQDGISTNIYTVTITRALSTNATLALLQIGGQTISPAFATGTTSYTATVSNAITSIRAEAFTNEAHATLTINGYAVASGAASPSLPLNIGSNTIL